MSNFNFFTRVDSLGTCVLLFVLGATATTSACNGDPERNDGDGMGGQGGEGQDDPAGSGGAPPLYGEDPEDTPAELRLRFLELSVTGSQGATDFAFLPDDDELLMTRRGGSLLHLALDGERTVSRGSWDLEEEILTDGACGLTNIVLDPDFEENRFIYLTYCADDLVTRLVRYEWDEEDGPSRPSVIFETVLDEAKDVWHRFGSLGFDDDGVMWFFLGEHFHKDFAQDFSTPHGALHRIVPNRDPNGAGYEPAEGNMQVGMGGAGSDVMPFPSLYAYGLRSPWRGTLDSLGRFWVGDVGEYVFEEVNVISAPGQNFGWPIHEGPCVDDCAGFVDPITHYGRTVEEEFFTDDPLSIADSLRAIWVGQIYESPAVDRYHGLMDGVVVYGDLFTGAVRGLRADEAGELTMNAPLGHLERVTQWKPGPDGYVYALDLGGQLHVALLEGEAD